MNKFSFFLAVLFAFRLRYVCRDLLGCDISSEEGVLYAREKGLFKDICPRMVESAVDILEEMEI